MTDTSNQMKVIRGTIDNLEGKLAEANSKIAFLYSDNSQRALRREPDADLAIRQQAIALQYSLSTATMAANAYGEMDIETIISEADHVAHWIKTGEKPADRKASAPSGQYLEGMIKEAEDHLEELRAIYTRQTTIADAIRALPDEFKAAKINAGH